MFNNTSNTSITKTSVSFNSPATGILQRSHPKSKFVRFSQGSDYEKVIFGIEPYEYKTYSERFDQEKKPIIVLQVLLVNSGFLVEYMFEEDLTD